jgi:hypothetical protein
MVFGDAGMSLADCLRALGIKRGGSADRAGGERMQGLDRLGLDNAL